MDYQKSQTREQQAATKALLKEWRRMGADFDASWALIAANVSAVMLTAQVRIAAQAVEYIPDVLEDTGQTRAISASDEVNPRALVGATASGLSVDEALFGSVVVSKLAIRDGATVAQALKVGADRLTRTAGTIMSDTGRGGERLGMAVRPVTGYVRMLTPPSCGRCAILAGQHYSSSTAFRRHPKCDCRHIPSTEAMSDDLTTDPKEYFDSLPTAEELAEKYPDLTVKMRNEAGIYSQEDVFTKGGAEAIRNGADVSQVINARRGMKTTTDGLKATTAGITRRGWYGGHTAAGRAGKARLMPEALQSMAKNKAEYLRLLKNYGYIL